MKEREHIFDNSEELEKIELELIKKGCKIRKIPEDELIQCSRDDCFEQAGCFIEGQFYCPHHRGEGLRLIKEIYEDAEIRTKEQKEIEEKRLRDSKVKWEK